MLQENSQLSKLFWGRHLWGKGFFVATSGNITDEMTMKYVENQSEKEKEDDFSISFVGFSRTLSLRLSVFFVIRTYKHFIFSFGTL